MVRNGGKEYQVLGVSKVYATNIAVMASTSASTPTNRTFTKETMTSTRRKQVNIGYWDIVWATIITLILCIIDNEDTR